MKPHKWQKEIIAWANGAEIQYKDKEPWDDWHDCGDDPDWNEQEGGCYFRVKPEPKPDVVNYLTFNGFKNSGFKSGVLKLIWDGETGKLKSVEVLK